jgi:hypothetical protein
MTLNEFLAKTKRDLFDDITSHRPLRTGVYDSQKLDDLSSKGEPQIGTETLEPEKVVFEFIFKMPDGQASVIQVEVVPPQRITYLPVPEWVVESIWQGEVSGSYHFESDAHDHLRAFERNLQPEQNADWFKKQSPKRRE